MNNISICTFARNRIEHSKLFINFALEVMDIDDELVFVDYNDPQLVGDYVQTIEDKRITLVKVPLVEFFHINHARNSACKFAKHNILLIIDVDMRIDLETLNYVRNNVNDERFLHGGYDTNFSPGSCAITKTMFKTINGFEEMFTGWGAEDTANYQMLLKNGFRANKFPSASVEGGKRGVLFLSHRIPGPHTREQDSMSTGEFNTGLMNYINKSKRKSNNFHRTVAYGAVKVEKNE